MASAGTEANSRISLWNSSSGLCLPMARRWMLARTSETKGQVIGPCPVEVIKHDLPARLVTERPSVPVLGHLLGCPGTFLLVRVLFVGGDFVRVPVRRPSSSCLYPVRFEFGEFVGCGVAGQHTRPRRTMMSRRWLTSV